MKDATSRPARAILAIRRWAAAPTCLILAAAILTGAPADAETLRVLRTGLGQGTVTGTGIACGTDCNESFGPGQTAALTAAPAAGSIFAGWGGDCAGTASTCTVPVGALTSVRAAFAPAIPPPLLADVTPAGISTYLNNNPAVDTPAEFIAALPPDYRENWILMVRSESLQTGTASSPRILLPSADYRRVLTVGMTSHASYPGSDPNAIEFMEWDATQMNFRFHEIVLAPIPALGDVVRRTNGQPDVYRFPPRGRGVSVDDAKCFACHSTRNVLNDAPGATPGTDGIPPGSVAHKSKPNWDTYDSWGGMLAFNRDRLYQGSVEVAAFRKIFNPWTWQGNDTVRPIVEQLELQPTGVPPNHVISRNTGGGANDGHISFPFDGGAIVTREPLPTGTPGGSTNYAFDGAAGLGTATNLATNGNFVTMHSSGSPGCFQNVCGPTSDEGRGVNLFDELFANLNPQRVADEVANHRFATGSVPFDVRPLALAVAQSCFAVTDSESTQTLTSTPTLSQTAALRLPFFNERHGITSFDQLYDDTRLRQTYLTLRKADIQAITLDRSIDFYAYDANRFAPPPPPALIDGLVQAYGAATEAFTPPLSADQLLARLRTEVFRRADQTLDSTTLMNGIYVDREAYLSTSSKMALYRYFLEPLGVSVDKWSIAVRGRSRTYTMADVFMGVYDNALAGRLKPALGLTGLGMVDTCNAVMPLVETSLNLLPAASAMPKFTDIQRIFNRSCIECHGGLGYPPYLTYSPRPAAGTLEFDQSNYELDFSENEAPPPGERRLDRSHRNASVIAAYLLDRVTDGGDLAHPYNPDEPYNRANPNDAADPDVLDERCPYGVMPCGGPPLSWVDIETISRWVAGGAPNSEGDPHIRTVDGVNYDLQATGEFVLLQDEGLKLQVRHTPVTTAGPLRPDPHSGLSSCVSVNTAVALRTGGQRVTLQPELTLPAPGEFEGPGTVATPGALVLRIEGKPTELGSEPILLASGGRIRSTPVAGGVQIEDPGGTTVVVTPGFWTHHGIWYLNVGLRRARGTEGLMGPIAPGNWLPALPDGSQLGPLPSDLGDAYRQLNHTFADAWRVTDATSLFDYEEGLSTASFALPGWPEFAPNDCIAPPVHGGSAAPAPPPLGSQEAERLCSDLTEPARKANCLADVALTGEAGFAATYVGTEALELNEGPTPPTLGVPENFAEDVALPVRLSWTVATDGEGDGIKYRYCVWRAGEIFAFDKCGTAATSPITRDSILYVLLTALGLLILLLVLFLVFFRRRPQLLILVAILLLPLLLLAFHLGRGQGLNQTIAGLDPTGRYLWKVIAEDERGAIVESRTRQFTVR